MTNARPEIAAVVHVRYNGRSHDLPLDRLGVPAAPSDDALKTAVARFLEVPVSALSEYVVERHATGNLTLRPEAIFG